MTAPIDVPDPVRRKALAVGPAGERWLTELGILVGDLAREWGIRVGATLAGGSGAFVAQAITADGTDAVVKVSIPDGLDGHTPFAEELYSLRLGARYGYVEALRADTDCRAMLQERLGRAAGDLGLSPEEQIDVIAETLCAAWHRAPANSLLRSGAAQAASLRVSIRAEWERLARPCHARTLERAEEYALAREEAFDVETAVLVHGDAHPANVLEDPATPGRFKLIDPDAMISEPAHDLAIPLRDWTEALLRADDPTALGLRWCARLGAAAHVEAGPIWEWAYLERVSTGLLLLRLGDPLGAQLLEIADRWTDVHP